MLGGLGNLGNMAEMMKNAKQMAEQAKKKQEEARSKVVEGSAGGGMVSARMNGAGDLVGLDIDKAVIDPEDPEMMADLIIAAVGAAQKKVNELKLESIKEMTGGLDLSALGIDMSNLDGMM